MLKIKGLLFVFGTLAAASAASAGNVSWDCKVPAANSTRLIAGQYLFNYDADKSAASVVDPIINYHKKNFIPVSKIKVKGDKVVFSWKIRTGNASQKATLSYTASIDRKSGRFNVHAIPLGYDNSDNVGGTCKELPGPLVRK
ncbi:MAG: hypothetical protein LCH69_16545 [Proteobacteria bacterium]|nr:hypothetical protein [Pseudomonadota bacterium]